MNFIIRRSRPGTISGKLPNAAAVIGLAMKYSAKDADTGANTFAVADGTGTFAGFVTREVRTTAGLTDEEQLMGFGLETPFEANKEGSVEMAEELEVEGSDYIIGSGATGAITSNTAAGTKLGFTSGKFRVAQSGDYAHYVLVKQMTPLNGGACRLYLRELEGIVV